MVCACRLCILARGGEFSDERVEDGLCLRIGKQAGGEELLSRYKGIGIPCFDERVEPIRGAEVLLISTSLEQKHIESNNSTPELALRHPPESHWNS